MKVTATIKLDGVLYEQEFDWPAVPRRGDRFLLDDDIDGGGGWSETVRSVWWSNAGRVTVEVGNLNHEPKGMQDSLGEGLAQALLDHGWQVFGENE